MIDPAFSFRIRLNHILTFQNTSSHFGKNGSLMEKSFVLFFTLFSSLCFTGIDQETRNGESDSLINATQEFPLNDGDIKNILDIILSVANDLENQGIPVQTALTPLSNVYFARGRDSQNHQAIEKAFNTKNINGLMAVNREKIIFDDKNAKFTLQDWDDFFTFQTYSNHEETCCLLRSVDNVPDEFAFEKYILYSDYHLSIKNRLFDDLKELNLTLNPHTRQGAIVDEMWLTSVKDYLKNIKENIIFLRAAKAQTKGPVRDYGGLAAGCFVAAFVVVGLWAEVALIPGAVLSGMACCCSHTNLAIPGGVLLGTAAPAFCGSGILATTGFCLQCINYKNHKRLQIPRPPNSQEMIMD